MTQDLQTLPPPARPAAQYLRMSTERQTYSLQYQSAHNAAYALAHGFEIVRTYQDAGVSGLRLNGREGLKALLADVIGDRPPFAAVLVYDVSRWGRFQDIDQGAHYEFVCREAGVEIVYTAEPFQNDGDLGGVIVKHLKRAMAAEYSRDLSAKIVKAQRGLAQAGFWMGGPAGYGLRRLAVTPDREPLGRMEPGEHKALKGCRSVLVHGPDHEVETVRRIYSLFLTGGLRIPAIAAQLNREGVPAEDGGPWSSNRVRQVLTNEKYAGAFHCRKSSHVLGHPRHARRRRDWVRVAGSVEPIVSPATFEAVQRQFRRPRSAKASDAELLEDLRRVLRDHGRISRSLLDAHPETHCGATVVKRFGGLLNALRQVGVEPSRRQLAADATARRARPDRFRHAAPRYDKALVLEGLRAHLATRGHIDSDTIDDDPALPSAGWCIRHFGGMARIYALLGYTPPPRRNRRGARWSRALGPQA